MSEATKLVESMGDAAKKLADVLVELLKKLEENRKAMEKATLKEQQKLKDQFGKTLQDAGYEASDENIDLLQKQSNELKARDEQIAKIDQQLADPDLGLDELEIEGLKSTKEALLTEKQGLLEGKGLEGLKKDPLKQMLGKKAAPGVEAPGVAAAGVAAPAAAPPAVAVPPVAAAAVPAAGIAATIAPVAAAAADGVQAVAADAPKSKLDTNVMTRPNRAGSVGESLWKRGEPTGGPKSSITIGLKNSAPPVAPVGKL